MPEAPGAFRVLYRDFLFRVLDLELLPAVDDIERLLGQFAAMLAAFSFTFAVFGLPKYIASSLPHERLAILARSEEEFLIATTMTIAGLFAVLAWNNVLPARRDCLVLGVLPIRVRTVFLAKAAALATALAVGVFAVNVFTGFVFPWLVAGSGFGGAMQSLAAYWMAAGAAGLFVFCALVALEGAAAQMLPHRLFLRMSAALQFCAFFAILGGYMLKPSFPNFAPPTLAHAWEAWLPSFWFFALFQLLNGARDPLFHALALRGLWALAAVFGAAAVSFGLAYARAVRNIN